MDSSLVRTCPGIGRPCDRTVPHNPHDVRSISDRGIEVIMAPPVGEHGQGHRRYHGETSDGQWQVAGVASRVGHGGRVRHVFEDDKTVPQPRRGLGAGKSVAACRKPRVPVSSDLRWPDAPLVADAQNRPGPCPQHGPGLFVHGLRVERPTQIARVDRRAEGAPRVDIWFRLRRFGGMAL